MEDVAMAAFTYPGVYIEEISSGQHTISGVATSIAAFAGWTNQGPVGNPTMVENWSQYQAQFGGFIPGNYLGYAVYQFFANGGSQAYIVRLVDSTATTAGSLIGGLYFFANNPGKWGSSITVSISNVKTTGTTTTFNLAVSNSSGQTLESYTNLSTASTDPTYALTVINNDSNYISLAAPGLSPATTLPMTVASSAAVTGTFTAGEVVTQTGSGATAVLVVAPTGTEPMVVQNVSGAPAATGDWKDSGGAVFAPSALPAVTVTAASAALSAGSYPTTGSDGTQLTPNTAGFATALNGTNGYKLLANVPIFNILCVPGENDAGVIPAMIDFCKARRAFMIVDADQSATQTTLAAGPTDHAKTSYTLSNPSYAAFYYPWVLAPDPAAGFRPTLFPPSGFVAGNYASTDANRGVWKAPAGIQATLSGSLGLQIALNDAQNGNLNPYAVNCLRQFPVYGNVVWGARTMDGADAVGSEYKYVNLRRLAMFIESSLYQGTQWVVFEPNAEPLWGQVRLSIGTFLQQLFLQGAFAGTSPQTAYFVKCDADNNPDATVSQGIVNITVGFAPLYPAEFVVIQITQMLNS
jgi:phage tail sheath protein FI